MSKKYGYGSTTASDSGVDYADRLIFAKPPEDMAMRQTVWNQVRSGSN